MTEREVTRGRERKWQMKAVGWLRYRAMDRLGHLLRPGSKSGIPIRVTRGSPLHVGMRGLGLLFLAGLALWGGGQGIFAQSQLTTVAIYAIGIAGLNIATGYTGMVSVGHSALFGLGAFTTGILVVKENLAPEGTLPVSVLVCFVGGLVVGLPALRIRGLYLAMVTLAFGVAFPELVNQLGPLTGGDAGLTIPEAALAPPAWTGLSPGQEGIWLYWLSIAVLAIGMLVTYRIVAGRYGLALMATRDDELAASASGVNVALTKIVAFGVSGALTGVGGSLFAMYLGNLTASDSFTLTNAILLLTGLIVGGQATVFGPIIGGFAVVYLPEWTSAIGNGESAGVFFGAILILMTFFAPEGVVGAASRAMQRVWIVLPSTPIMPAPVSKPSTLDFAENLDGETR